MAMRAHYDGSWENGKGKRVITLAGFAANETKWGPFETRWAELLTAHKITEFHMADVMSFYGEFEREKGWEETRRKALLTDVLNCISQSRLDSYACSVLMDDYEHAKADIPKLMRPPAICVQFCVGGLTPQPGDLDGPKPISIFFDINEPFMHHVRRVWEKARGRRSPSRNAKAWFNQISTIAPAVSSDILALQAADFLAWCVRRHHQFGDEEWLYFSATIVGANNYMELFDYNRIMEKYPNG